MAGVLRWLGSVSLCRLLFFSLVLRLALLCYGEWQDRNFAVKFTDIDYHVFSDAAGHVARGKSPFLRPTYRYTPLLAMLLVPNHYLIASFGKLLFIAGDLASGWLIHRMLTLQAVDDSVKILSCSLWLLNPLTATVSSRGNAESLLAVLVLSSLYTIMCRRTFLSGILYGLAVHMKIFPIIYSLPFFLLLDDAYCKGAQKGRQAGNWTGVKGIINRERVLFTTVSAMTFFIISATLFLWYGSEFIHEAYLYHISRRDTRHNFSVYFYLLYLLADSPLSLPVGILAFLPQAVLLLTAAVTLYRDVTFCVFVQTVTFVTFNKVCTSQYFLWYLCLLPLIVPFSKLGPWDALVMATLWFIGQGLWLAPAYYLEFQGYNTFFLIWIAGLLFFGINIFILVRIIQNHTFQPTFHNECHRKVKAS